jgi:hypothetical protein
VLGIFTELYKYCDSDTTLYMRTHNISFREEMITSKWRLTLLIGICICMLFTAGITTAYVTYTEESSVSGVGYVSVNKDFQTYPDDCTKNRATTLVQHGTGSYDTEQEVRYTILELELLGFLLYDGSFIQFSEDTQLEYSPVSLDGINLSSTWYANLRNENHRLENIEEWIGAGTTQIAAIVKDKATGETIAQLSECYVGNFTLNEKLKVKRAKAEPIALQLLLQLLFELLLQLLEGGPMPYP